MKKICLVLSLLLLLSSCGAKPHSRTLFLMDTVMQLTVYGDDAEDALAESEQILAEYDRACSPTEGETPALNQAQGGALSPILGDVLAQSLALSEETNGAFDPALGRLIALWQAQTVPDTAALSAAKRASGHDKVSLSADRSSLTLRDGATLHFGAIAKGAASDALYRALTARGIKSAILSLGGNVVALGAKPDGSDWTVGVRDPDGGENDYLATIPVTDRFVVSSGDYERFFEQDGVRYHHILDPKTGYPAQNDLRSTVIVAKNGAMADAYSTALFVMGSAAALDFWRAHSADFELILILKNKKIIVSEGLSGFRLTNGAYTYEVAHR